VVVGLLTKPYSTTCQIYIVSLWLWLAHKYLIFFIDVLLFLIKML